MDTNKRLNSPVFFVGLLVLLWQLGIIIVTLITIQLFEFTPTFPYASNLIDKFGPRLFTSHAYFDGVHYLTIMEQGYVGTGLIQAFFPLYPIIVKITSFNLLLNPVIIGTFISLLCFTTALIVWWKLMTLDNESTTNKQVAILLLITAPAAFFFANLYSESLFLLLSLSSFYFARTKHWWLAGIVAAGASATRITGIFLIPGLLWEYWQQKRKLDASLLLCFLPLVGIGLYMLYLQLELGDALMFIRVQDQFGAQRDTTRLIMLYQVLFRYFKMLISVPLQSWTYYQVVLELAAAFFGIIGLILSYLKLRRSYFWYALPAFLLPTLTGTFSSVPRYLIVLFPLYWAYAKLNTAWIKWLIVIVGAILQIINLILFTQGKWVA